MYYSTLNQQILNNERLGRALASRTLNAGVMPIPPVERTLDMERGDTIKQRQIALAHLLTIMQTVYANRFLERIGHGEWFQLNSLWGVLKKRLEGRANIDDAFLYQVWQRVKRQANKNF